MPPTAPPPLTPWGHTWRYLLTLVIAGIAWSELVVWQWSEHRWWFWLDLVLGLTGFVLMWWRRSHPLAVTTVVTLLTAVSGSAGGPATLVLFSLATRRRWREILPMAVLGFVCGLALLRAGQTDEPEIIIVTTLAAVVGVTVGWGMYVGSRRELLTTLRERALTAETEQASRVAQARTTERSRIAREMHDVLAHRISLVTMHAGALTYRKDLSSEQVQETAGVIRDNAHQALTELREVLGVLREDAGDARPELPQPDASDLTCLISEARSSGMHLQISIELELDEVPPGAGRTLYRVVQEGLTNARKHAPDTLVTVRLSGAPGDALVAEVRNPLPIGAPLGAPASGLGLVGLRERAELAGGHLHHEIDAGGSFVLRVWLPWLP